MSTHKPCGASLISITAVAVIGFPGTAAGCVSSAAARPPEQVSSTLHVSVEFGTFRQSVVIARWPGTRLISPRRSGRQTDSPGYQATHSAAREALLFAHDAFIVEKQERCCLSAAAGGVRSAAE